MCEVTSNQFLDQKNYITCLDRASVLKFLDPPQICFVQYRQFKCIFQHVCKLVGVQGDREWTE